MTAALFGFFFTVTVMLGVITEESGDPIKALIDRIRKRKERRP
ncbi:MAG: hypothetical protein Q3986_07470 [Akkermansia sp.]|nr:hypothetical protein [Akkermansia sp.]